MLLLFLFPFSFFFHFRILFIKFFLGLDMVCSSICFDFHKKLTTEIIEIQGIVKKMITWASVFFFFAAKAGLLSGFPGIESIPGPQLPEIEFLNRFNGLIYRSHHNPLTFVVWILKLALKNIGFWLCRRKPEEVRWSWCKIQVISLAEAAVRAVKAEQRKVIHFLYPISLSKLLT